MDSSITRLSLLLSLFLASACSSGGGAQPSAAADPAASKPSTGQDTPKAGGQNAPPAGNLNPQGTGAQDSSDASNDPSALGPPPYKVSNRLLLQWKRHAAFEADLMGALHLSRDQLCVEVGGKNCIRDVHLVPLGGNEPYESGLMKPSAEPLATTSSVVDRVLLSACTVRARLDREGKPEVFSALNLNGPLPAAGDPALATTITDLYRRFLARDPLPHEVEIVAALAQDEDEGPLSTQDFAALACFSIGSTTEFLFF